MTTKYFNIKQGMTTGNVLVSDGNVTLGNVGNLHISGGNSGYLLRTDGANNLTWVDPAATQSAAPMPLTVDDGNTLTITANYQGLYGTPMTIDGTLVIDGVLVDVSGQGAPGSNSQITFNDNGDPAGNNGFTFNKTTGNLNTPGNINVAGNVIPSSDLVYDLGSATRRFRDLYLSGNTINLGGAILSATSTALILTNPEGGNFVVSGNGNAGTSVISNGTSNVNIPMQDSNVVVTAAGNTSLVVSGTQVNVASNLKVTGTSNLGPASNVKITGGTANYVLATDGLGNLTWVEQTGGGGGGGSSIANGTSNVFVELNANVRISVAGYANRYVFGDDLANFAGNLKVNGMVTSGNANLGNTATANFFVGNLVGLADQANLANTALAVNGNAVVGEVANSNHAATSNTVTNNSHPNITSVGTLTSLVVTGNVQSANHFVSNNITGNATSITISAAGTNQNVNIRPTGTGIVDVGNFRLGNLANPVNASDAATKDYVDSTAQGLHTKEACQLATTTALTATYNNGTSGVGATLTGTTNSVLPTIDGYVSPSVGYRILVKNQANAVQNGIYDITDLGKNDPSGRPWVLTRSSDFDNTPSGEVEAGDFVFIQEGSTLAGSGWTQTALGTGPGEAIIIGTDAITFSQFSGGGTYTAGDGLSLVGTQFSVNTSLPNLTSVGTLTSLIVSGNITAGNIIGKIAAGANDIVTTGNISANNISGVFANGNSSISIPAANGNILFSIAGNSNVIIASGAGIIVAGNITSNGGSFTGNGAGLSNINGPNVTGSVANAAYAVNAGSTDVAVTVTANAQPNITSLGTLGNLIVTGNANVGTIHTDSIKYANGQPYQFTTNAGGANTQVQFNDANIFGGSANFTFDKTTNTLSVTNIIANGAGLTSITGANITGTVANATYAVSAGSAESATTAGTVTTNAQPNITSVGTLSTLSVTGNANVGNIGATQGVFTNVSGNGSALSSLTGANVTGTVANATYATSAGSATTAGTVTTNAQPNITSVGTLTSLSVTGNGTFGNVYANSGIIAAQTLKGEGGNISNIQGANVSGAVSSATNATSATTAGTVTSNAQPNITSVGTLSSLAVTGDITSGNVYANSGMIAAQSLKGDGGNISNIQGANVSGAVATATSATSATTAGTVTTAAQPNITSVGTLSSLTVTGNTTSGNFYANSGTVGASLLTGTLTTAAQPNITSVGSLTSLTVTGNISAGNLTTGGVLTVTGVGQSNIAGNLSMGSKNIINLAEPVNPSDAATKQYVDDVAQGLHTHDSCNAATTGTLATISGGTVTYNNGTSGVGATLTTTGSYTTIDGVTLSNGMRILVKDEANTAHNGIYTRTSSTVLTRATDFDTSTEMAGGDFTFVTAGTLYDNTGWVMTDIVTTVGTDPVLWTQFSGAGTYTAGTGLTLTGSTFSVNASQTQITSLGTLTGLGVNGTITGVNITANTGVFTGNGSGLSAIAGANVTGTVSSATTAGTVTTAAQPNITSLGTLTGLGVNGTITGVNITANTGVFTGNGSGLSALNASNLSTGTVPSARLSGSYSISVDSATTAGTVTTAAQPNITSVGTLTGLGVNGTITGVNITANTGVFTGNGSALTALNASNISSGTLAQARLANSSLTVNGTAISLGSSGTVTASTTNALTIGSYLTGGSFNGGSAVTIAVDATSANTASKVVARDATGNFSAGFITGTFVGGLTTAAQPNVTSLGTLTSLTVSGNTSTPVVNLQRSGGNARGLSFYDTSYSAWSMYMSPGGAAGSAPNGTVTAPTGNLVTSWALRSFIENGAGYGWTFESGSAQSTTPSIVAEIRSSDGSFRTAGNVYAVGDVITNYSDERLKDKQGNIENAIEKVSAIETFYYRPNDIAKSLGVADELNVGVSAQSVNNVAPEVVTTSPLSDEYLTVKYDRLVPYLIEAIKEQQKLITDLQNQINELKDK